jgi:AcrR family transcriptional regulator
MARRKGAIDRDALREKLIAVAEALVVQGGASALTARALATHIGYSLGHVYNLVSDLDELALLVNGRTLSRLIEALQDALEDSKGSKRIYQLAQTYLEFCDKNAALWELVLSHRLRKGQSLPEDYAALIGALPALVSAELKALYPKRSAEALRRDVATLWSALHGLSLLDHTGRLELIGAPKADVLAKQLLDSYLAGLKGETKS